MAKSDNRISKLRKDVDKLRKNYTGAFTSANRAVYDGIEQLAEHELAALKTHYEEAIKSLKTLRKGGAPRELAPGDCPGPLRSRSTTCAGRDSRPLAR